MRVVKVFFRTFHSKTCNWTSYTYVVEDHQEINDPTTIDIDTLCFTMLMLDLPNLFIIICHSTDHKVKVKDHSKFDMKLHVASKSQEF